jgi:hypothetical protein
MSTRATRTTSPQRTYRYLRIAIAGTVVVILVAIGVTIPVVGVLPSLSHYYYTPAGSMFVAALIAAGVCFFALSGSGPERALLDVAALLVPLMAIVPTVISPGSVPGVDADCVGACVPEAYDEAVAAGMATYLIVGVVILLFAVVLTIAGQVERAGALPSLGVAAGVLLVTGLAWWLWRAAFLQWAHFVAAICFFGVIAAVALVNAFWPAGDRAPSRWLTVSYVAIAILLAIDVVALPIFGRERFGPFYGVFIGEVLALLLFAAFWVLQSIQNWPETDPAALA